MKKTYIREMVAHLWANQSQDEARNEQGTFYFEGDTIYSYGAHFPIARHVETKKGKFILFTTQGYSRTTDMHKGIVWHAIADQSAIIFCRDVMAGSGWSQEKDLAEHEANLKDMADSLTHVLKQAARAKSRFPQLWKEAERLVWCHTGYREVFGLKSKVKALTISADWKERAKAKLKAEADARKEEKATRQSHEALVRQHNYDNMLAWIEGAELPHDGSSYNFPEIRIRLKDAETVETSRGAEVPLSDARKLWNLVHMIYIGDREPYYHNGHSLHAGSFVVNEISKEGALRAGCHTLTYEAMKDFAAKMGWPMPIAGQTTLEF